VSVGGAADGRRPPRVLLAKTSLDGHWRGVMIVARVLRDAGFEVVNLGEGTADQIAAAARDEDVDLVGLNVGGRVEVVERVVERVRALAGDVPVFAGGTVPPWAAKRLADVGVKVFPPGSSRDDIAAAARMLTTSTPGAG